MTNHTLPGRQLNARWSSGNPTIAPSGATWLRGAKWGAWRGALAMAVLGSQELVILKFDADASWCARSSRLCSTETMAACAVR